MAKRTTEPHTPANPDVPPQNAQNDTPDATSEVAKQNKSAHFDALELSKIKAASAWRPEVGGTVTGTVVAIVGREDKDYGMYPVVILRVQDVTEYLAIHSFHQVMINELREAHAAPGVEITVRYNGKKDHNKARDDAGNPRKYHAYSVVPAEGATLTMWDFTTDKRSDDENPGY
jgi:hypothetical protein